MARQQHHQYQHQYHTYTATSSHHKAQNDKNFESEIPSSYSSSSYKEAQELLEKAKRIRESLEKDEKEQQKQKQQAQEQSNSNNDAVTTTNTATTSNSNSKSIPKSVFNVEEESPPKNSVGYRLYIDIGREEGTWMDPRWGASGKRIEFTTDVSFVLPSSSSNDDDTDIDTNIDISLASKEIIENMVKDNLSGKSTSVRILNSAPKGRLRNGFDDMNTYGGGYRIDVMKNNSNTARFYISVNGTEEKSTYGDIYIPKGNLYFSLPCFGNNVKSLSSKEGIVTVRQFGWHTGWRREESRIVGVFRAVPIDKAMRMDGF